MTAWRRRSVGQRLDQLRELCRTLGLAPAATSRACGSRVASRPVRSCTAEPLGDEVDGLADGLDLGGLLLGDGDPVGVLELHHELVEIERVRVEVLPEAGRLVDPVGGHLELGRQVLAHLRQHLLAAQAVHVHRSFLSRIRGPRRLVVAVAAGSCRIPPASSRSARPPAPRPRAPPAAPRWRCPPARSSRDRPPRRRAGRAGSRPPVVSGSIWRRRPPSAGRSSSPPAAARGPERAAARTASAHGRCAVPSIVFRTTLPVNPSVTITSALPGEQVAALEVARGSRCPSASARRRVGLDDLGRALLRLLADREQRRPAARATPSTALAEGGAEVGELDQVDRRGPRCWRPRRAAASAGPACRGRPAGRPAPGGARPACGGARTGRRSSSPRSAPALASAWERPSATSRAASTTEASAASGPRRPGSSALVISSGGGDQLGAVDRLDVGERTGVAEHPQPIPSAAAARAPATITSGPRSAPRPSRATGGGHRGPPGYSCVVAGRLGRSRLGDLVLDHLATRVGAADRADAMRQAGAVAARALVEPRRARLVRARAACRGGCSRSSSSGRPCEAGW